jgi:hypothetical protein
MKRNMTGLVLALVMASSTAFALQFDGTNKAGEGVVKSKHNMNLYTNTTHDAQGRVCAFCHTPHHALPGGGSVATYMPLWSHTLPQMTFVPYNTFTVTDLNLSNELQGPSILCMSCHDGSIAVDQHYGNDLATTKLTSDAFNPTEDTNVSGTAVGLPTGGKTDLSNDHPIGFLYSDAYNSRKTDLFPESTVFKGGGTKKISDVLTNGYMTCATCHDVHNKDNKENSVDTTVNYFLYGDQKDSAFCITCHNK